MKKLITLVILFGLIGAFFIAKQESEPAEPSLTIVSFGGAYQDAQKKAYMLPFSKQDEINIIEGEYNGEYGILYQRSTSKKSSWDVVSVESSPALRGQQENIFSIIPDSVFDGISLVENARRPTAAGHLLFSTILGYRTDLGGNKPMSWSDFWDINNFPGKRGLRNNPRGTLEIALLADGVSGEKLYPLDVNRAFKKLDELRENIVFWESGAQPVQLLANGLVTMTSVYNGRIWDAKKNEKLPFGWEISNGLLEIEYWVVPKNSTNKQVAFDFIRFSLQSAPQAEFSNTIAYIPTNSEALLSINSEVKSAIPDINHSSDQIIVNAEWWAENQAKVSARWEGWIAKR